METKFFNQEQLFRIYEFLLNKNYLERNEVQILLKEFNFCHSVFKRELFKNNIPFISGNASLTLKSFGINIENNEMECDELNKMEDWKINCLKNSKIIIKYICKCCNEKSKSRLSHMILRKFFKREPICSNCIIKSVTNTHEWKDANSKAQFIAQNKPEQIEKNRNKSIALNKDPEFRKRKSNSLKIALNTKEHKELKRQISLKKWEDPEYARSVIEKSKKSFVTGFYKNIYYNSSYEFAFLIKMQDENNFEKIKRANFYIDYINSNGKKSHYYPDFTFENLLIEVKGYGPWVDLENLRLKNLAAKKWCKKNKMKFRLVEKEDLTNYYINLAIKQHKKNKNEVKK